MTGPITERIREFLLRRGPKTEAEVASAIPELAERGGEQRALLLLRLDAHVERIHRGEKVLWAARGSVLTDERKVRQAAEEYFKRLNRPGAPLSSAAKAIAAETGLSEHRVEDLLRQRYKVVGTNIFNRPSGSGGNVR